MNQQHEQPTTVLPAAAVARLRCPTCGHALRQSGSLLRCPSGHAFNVARQGYVHLAGRLPYDGDTTEMVLARHRFLRSGAYDFLTAALIEAVPPTDGLIVDAGAGTGHHLAGVLDAHPRATGLAVDISKPALRRAARAHRRAAAVLADSWRHLPIADRAADAILNVFAPRNGAEFARILRRQGTLVVATPAPEHLVELVEPLGLLRVDPDKPARVAAGLRPWFHRTGERRHTRRLHLTREQAHAWVQMGPSAWHTDMTRTAEAIAALPTPLPVTAAVRITTYARR